MDIRHSWNAFKTDFSEKYANNKRNYNIIGLSVVAVVGGILFYTLSYKPTQEIKASEKFASMYYYFKTDSTSVVLKGDAKRNIWSATRIADEFGSTVKGREAALCASIALMKEKKFEEALKYLGKTKANDKILSASIIAMKAVCNAELGDTKEAANLYEQASRIDDNDFSAMYLKKAGIHYEMSEDFSSALSCY
jgi:tetratricopeptide (TPR) repeat protein